MREAYKAAAKLNRRLIERQSQEDADHLMDTQVVVVEGCYDKGQDIFHLSLIPHTTIAPGKLARARLAPDQVLFVNCPGNIPPAGLKRVKRFVETGGLLVTTDWALKNVVEPLFPETVAYNGRATVDDVVRVVFEPVEDTFLEGLLDPEDDPQWWLEGSSYPIRILDRERVKVLVSSQEMKRKYGEAPIVVAFEWGEGKVYHMTSHFYLQRAETRTERHRQQGAAYARQKGVDLAAFDADERACLEQAPLGQVEAAYTSARALTNMVIEQGRRAKLRKLKGGAAAK